MNFKTTLILIGLLVIAGVYLLVTREKSDSATGTPDTAAQKVFDGLADTDVNKVVIDAGGKKMALEKTGAAWRLTEPVSAPAEAFEVDSLLRALTALESRGSAGSADAGLSKPSHTIDLATTGGKTYTLLVGDKSAVGDNLYVSRKDQGRAL
ncbi:MAG: DUF4340 domain-containing protein, partial [Tepidisphaeraceae bacterium]